MVSSMMNIPEKIHAGFNERDDTYTGKLAYVVYTDAKGKLRKEASWLSWSDDKIPKEDYTNEPTEGFVLNRNGGGGHHGWDSRNEFIRVWDPRGFEFEISLANLLFILEECSSIKGKGLEGKFVYAWAGTDLVLLPCDSEEYKGCVTYTDGLNSKVTKSDMVEGCTYQDKHMQHMMYLGRHSWFSEESTYDAHDRLKLYLKPNGKKHIFLFLHPANDHKEKPNYIVESGFTKLAKKTSDEPIADYADAYEEMINSIHCLVPTEVIFEKVKVTVGDKYRYGGQHVLIKEGDKYYPSYITTKEYYGDTKGYYVAKSKKSFSSQIKDGSVNVNSVHIDNWSLNHSYRHGEDEHMDKIIETVLDKKTLQGRDFYTALMTNEKGATFNLMQQ